MGPSSPQPLDALFSQPPPQVAVGFDAPLTPALLDVANWAVRYEGFTYTVLSAQAYADATVRLVLLKAAATALPNRVSFSPPPFDLLGLDLSQVQPFALSIHN